MYMKSLRTLVEGRASAGNQRRAFGFSEDRQIGNWRGQRSAISYTLEVCDRKFRSITSRDSKILRVDVVAFYLVVERCKLDSQQTCSAGLMTCGSTQRLANQVHFKTPHLCIEVKPFRGSICIGVFQGLELVHKSHS